ncbi:low molecular weight phosphatase family protein [Citricoccus nitrophenolicus]|uniref:arsenate-mycothiol transferase ArsC n=1 Tax=Citricoccus nitrophenolicus TaxID=863575 RepID=UPI0039B3D084
MTDQQATVLFVCTGNICRSAYGHHLLARELERTAPGRYRIVSAGTQVNPRLTVPSQIRGLQGAAGLQTLEAHSPTPLNARTVQRADLILAATEDHISRVLRDTPGALNRTFTMTEFGAAAEALRNGTLPGWDGPSSGSGPSAGPAEDLPERVRSLARHLARHRPVVRGSLDSIDLPDPYGREDAAYPAMAEVLEPAVGHMAQVLAGLAR